MSITKIKNGLIVWCLWNDPKSVHDHYAKHDSPPQDYLEADLSYIPFVLSNVRLLITKLTTNVPIYLHSTDEQSILESIKNHTLLYNEKKDTRYHSFDIESYEKSIDFWIDQNKIERILIVGISYNICLTSCYSILDKLQSSRSFEYYTVAGCTANVYFQNKNGKRIRTYTPVPKIDQKKFIDLEMI